MSYEVDYSYFIKEFGMTVIDRADDAEDAEAQTIQYVKELFKDAGEEVSDIKIEGVKELI